MLLLRALNPQTEQDLFREAYHWRNKKPSKLQPDRMLYSRFAADDPSQIVMGLFNGELVAVFMFHELEPGRYQAHFSTQRKADRMTVLLAAAKLVEWFKENDLQMVAFVTARNKPLRQFIENAGLYSQKPVSVNEIPYVAYSNGPF